MIFELNHANMSPLAAGMIWYTASRNCWRDTAERRVICSSSRVILCACSRDAWLACSAFSGNHPNVRLWQCHRRCPSKDFSGNTEDIFPATFRESCMLQWISSFSGFLLPISLAYCTSELFLITWKGMAVHSSVKYGCQSRHEWGLFQIFSFLSTQALPYLCFLHLRFIYYLELSLSLPS
jgi:hypothetical protein